MRARHVPVTMGSPRFRVADTGMCSVTDAWFPPNSVLEPHTHARAIFAVMLTGSFSNRIAGREYDCTPSNYWTEPLGEKHSNRGGSAGARVFVVQPDPRTSDVFAPFESLLRSVRYGRHGTIALDSRRVLCEIGSDDGLAPLAIDSLVLGVLISAARLTSAATHHAPPPRWVRQAREYVHEHYRRSFRISDVATLVGVEPSRLAHVFRRYYGSSVGQYARAQRLGWALEQLEKSAAPIAKIAVAAGYCDQSHLTREVRRALGVGPAEYRRGLAARVLEDS
jgi:AraC family transcriptional regulator